MISDPAFDAAFQILLSFEGGFQNAHDDPGNWTGGKVGAGELHGTNMGISAAQYPAEDIANLTKDRAHDLYKCDYWDRFGLWRLPSRVGIKLFVCGVDIGIPSAFICLQRALRACGQHIAEDGKLGPETLNAVQAAQYDALTASAKSEIAAHYRLVAAKEEAGDLPNWLSRAYA